MWGAIVGDVAGSYFENMRTKSTDIKIFNDPSFFTDDTVLTVAVADWILHGGQLHEYFHRYFQRYSNRGFGGTFIRWALAGETQPYNSWGNGSAMRVSPVAYARDSLAAVLELAAESAAVTHDHPAGIAGAQATAGSIFLARTGHSKAEIRQFVSSRFDYDLDRTLDQIRPHYQFDVSCAGSVPESILAFQESDSFESAVRLAISLGGDADTMACIAGSIAEAYYGDVPLELRQSVRPYLDASLLQVIDEFQGRFPVSE